jgi:hypothetical protein
VALIGIGVCLGLVITFGLWRRIPARAADIVLALLGMTVGAGALLLQDDPRVADWMITLGLLAAFTPLHCRFVFGPPGRSA